MTSGVHGVNHVACLAQDMDETVRFYERFLDIKVRRIASDTPGQRHYCLDIGGDGTLDFFVYRFKADGPWLAGAAGPYLRRLEPSVDDHGGTFSDLAPVGNRTPEDIVGPPAQIVTDWKSARR